MNDYEYLGYLVEEFKKTLIFCKSNLLNLKLDITAACHDIEVEISDHRPRFFYYYSKKYLTFKTIKEEYEKYLKKERIEC